MIQEVNARGSSRMRFDRRPGSIEEAQALIAYNERILASSLSLQRQERAARMLENVQFSLAQLEREADCRATVAGTSPEPVAAPPTREEEGALETVWNGTLGARGASLSGHGMGSSLGPGRGFGVAGARR